MHHFSQGEAQRSLTLTVEEVQEGTNTIQRLQSTYKSITEDMLLISERSNRQAKDHEHRK